MLSLGPALRWKAYYKVPQAGQLVGWGRSESYRLAEIGVIPTERLSPKLLGVPKARWDRIVRRLRKAR
jgi:hypothetical protein